LIPSAEGGVRVEKKGLAKAEGSGKA